MIIIDDFIKDEYILDSFSDVELWNSLDDGKYKTWDGMGYTPHDAIGDYIWHLKNKFWGDRTWDKFEYWVNITNETQTLDWHVDKDEALAEEGKVVCPQIGAVWYGFPHKVWGGYLEIENTQEAGIDIERIKPVYNRVVVFDVSQEHRVAPILAGNRYGMQVSLW